jgi:hypothetical protein
VRETILISNLGNCDESLPMLHSRGSIEVIESALSFFWRKVSIFFDESTATIFLTEWRNSNAIRPVPAP